MKKTYKVLCLAAVVAGLTSNQAFAQTDTYSGNNSTGFGGPLGNSTLAVSEDANTGLITFNLATTGGFNNIAFYIDSTAGGINDLTGLNDTGDAGRRSISGDSTATARAPITFATGFAPDYAIALDDAANANLFQLTTGDALTYISGANDSQNAALTQYSFSFNASQIGLTTANASSFSFVATLLNSVNGGQSGNDTGGVYRSNETIGASNADNNSMGNLGNDTLTFTGFDTYTLDVPEPSTWMTLMMGGALLGGFYVMRARQASRVS